MVDTRLIRAVDANVREKWETTNSLASLVYDFSDITGDIWWSIYDEDENVVAWGLGGTFSPGALAPGNYLVEVYFADVCDGGSPGYTSSAELHVLDVRLARLFETANEANRIFNPTRKDDTTGNPDAETETVNAGTPLEERYAAPRHYLYTVGDPVTGNFNVSAKFNATGAEGCTNYYCAFYQANGQKVPGTETNVDLTAETVAFSLPAPALATNVVWELRGGLDVNHNATLDNDEAAPFAIYTNSANVVKHAHIKGITKEQYEDDRQIIHGKVYFLYDNPPSGIARNARSMLALFYGNGNILMLLESMRPSQVTSFDINAFSNNGDCFSEWLTHNSGAEFSNGTSASVVQYTWTEDSLLSEFLADRTPFALKYALTEPMTGTYSEYATPTGERLHSYYDSHIKTDAEAVLNDLPDGTELYFPTNGWCEMDELLQEGVYCSLSSNWVSGVTVNVGQSDGYGGWSALFHEQISNDGSFREFDAFGTVGRGRMLAPKYRFKVQKNEGIFSPTSFDVTEVEFRCVLTDLYDFNREDGNLPGSAAALQLGYGAGRVPAFQQHGKIFTNRIFIKGVYRHPFYYIRD